MTESVLESTRRSFVSESVALRFSSPFFAALSQSCADDQDMLALGEAVRPGQPPAQFILLAAQFLVFQRPQSECAGYFPSMLEKPRPVDEAFPVFREFCLDRCQDLTALLSERTVNTTLVDRASYILPILHHVARESGEPLSLIEIGCSAGLNLLFDHYRYDYGLGVIVGEASSETTIRCRILDGKPHLDNPMPAIAQRVGVDLVEVDCSSADERLWMEAMLFPEWIEERRRLRSALAFRASTPLEIVIGNALDVLPALIADMPGPICVLHSHSLGQWSEASRLGLDRLLCEQSRTRTLHRIGVEAYGDQPPQRIRERLIKIAGAGIPLTRRSLPCPVVHTVYENSSRTERIIAEVDGLGSWIDWYS
ncbi:hypothetical protein ASD44_15755 [Mesorhizobium sp. Root554]|uniref:DUF2332 domain-containing protein n=1 Tax=unclassified Mesorhizobium TaxID=325217 RepID=UPI0006F2AB25|nr:MULTISPECIES: DUF2332 domain-containing protein [unclassified Mesorhizobium]KQZ15352.1 hypothetical protein ASD27_15760 [Mesorhizobium sp. Root1471]KQZ37860.1 hypothetical protein ASD44_15755 [Mesorhizobium sp. Root554]